MTRAKTSSPRHVPWIVALVFSLLFAQFAGLQHRIEHVSWQGERQAGLSERSDGVKNNSHHSCTIFDAATLADAVDTAPPCFLPAAFDYALAPWRAFASWDAPLLHHFQSRAPPLVLVLN